MHRFEALEQIGDRQALAALVGPIRTLRRMALATPGGFTGARHERLELTLESGVTRALVTKHIRISDDWTAHRSNDRRGRVVAMLDEPRLEPIWEAFVCPYLGFAEAGDEVALLMLDLTPHLLPDVREPLREDQEERLLGALAALHARFWETPVLSLPWLAGPGTHAGLLDACWAKHAAQCTMMPATMRENLIRGWSVGLRRLPERARRLVECPAAELDWAWRDLPRTLLHGDAKVANFALMPDRGVAAFDWALMGAGPPTVDLGWYLAVNATRLVCSKEATIRRYRDLLASARGEAISDACWEPMERAGILIGARMLLWSKALALEADRPGARAEWDWWTGRLEAIGA